MLPTNGIYHIINYSNKKHFDLETGNLAAHTPIIAWDGHQHPNQQWIVTCDGNLCMIKSNLPNGMYITTVEHIEFARVVTGKRERFELIEIEQGVYKLKVVKKDLNFTFPNDLNGCKVELRHEGVGNDLWIFEEVVE